MSGPIRHVLLDADGVVQDVPRGWFAPLEPYAGERAEEFVRAAWVVEKPTLAGDGDFLDLLGPLLAEYGIDAPVEEVFAAGWHGVRVSPGTLEVVAALRDNGYGVHLGTNQERHRSAHLREELGYDDLFDVACYSWELGAAKPDPAFFAAALERIGAEPPQVLFVDDSERNVLAAREVGLVAVHWSLAERHDALLARLGEHGVDGRRVSGPRASSSRSTC